MRLAAYLSRSRHGVFYFRWPIPARLHPDRKRGHVRLSLRTRCPAMAQRLSRVLVLSGQSQLASASASGMRYDEIRGQVAQHFQEQLARFKAGVMESGPPDEDRQVLMRNICAMLGKNWSDHADQIGADQAAQQVRAFCEHRGIDPDSLAPNVRQGLNEALVHGVGAFWQEAAGFLDSLERFDLNAALPAGAAVAAAPGDAHPSAHVSYQDVLAEYLTELQRTGQVRGKTADSKREALALLGEITDSKPVAAMTKADARRVKDVLLRYPKNRNKMAATKGKPLSDVLDLPGLETIATRTVNAYISALQTFFGWAVSHGHAAENIFDGTRVKLSRQAKEQNRQAFTDDQLKLLFKHLTENPDRLLRNQDHKWISLIGMFTGMRLNEIAQLDLVDTQQGDDGLWFIRVTDEGSPNKRLKNSASRRLVPLHDRLVAAGLPAFVEDRRKRGSARLFPALSYSTQNGYGRNPGRWFNDSLLPALGMQDAGLVFHSLRHTMATKLARADVPDTQVKAILGHEQQGVTFSTYFHGFRPAQLKAAIDKFDF